MRHIFPDLQVSMPLADGRALCIYRDIDKTCAALAQFSKKDADSYRDMHRRFDEARSWSSWIHKSSLPDNQIG